MVKKITMAKFTLNKNFEWGFWNKNNEINLALIVFDKQNKQLLQKVNLFKNVKKEKPYFINISIDFPEQPEVILGIVAVESDADCRKASDTIKKVAENELFKTAITALPNQALIKPAITLIASALSNNGDDSICDDKIDISNPGTINFNSQLVDHTTGISLFTCELTIE